MRSRFEKSIAYQLEMLVGDSGWTYEEYKYEYHRPVRSGECTECPSTKVIQKQWYTPDFFLKVGKGLIIEAKGKLTPKDREKMLIARELHPELKEKLCLLFMRNNPIRKGSKERYSDWAEKHGIDYSIWNVPDRWIE